MSRDRRILTLLTLLFAALALAACDDGGGSGGSEDTTTAGDMTTGPDGAGDVATTVPSDTTTPPADATDTTATTDTGPDVPSVCTEGSIRCGADGVETCTGGQWTTTENCELGCKAGACAMAGDFGTCAEPIVFGVGRTIRGTTDTTSNPYGWPQTCRTAYAQKTGVSASTVGPETVYELVVETPQQIDITLTPVDATYFGVYLRSSCADPGSGLHTVCDANEAETTPFTISGFYAPGRYSLFVDDFGSDGNGVGEFDLQVEPALIPECGGQVGQVLDLSAPVLLEGDTSLGVTSESWLGPECPIVQETSGQENYYVFGLAEASRVDIAVTPLEPSSSQLGVYIRDTCDERFDQVACAHTPGDSPAVLSEVLPAGSYYLFVDDFIGSIDEPQTYQLEISATPE